MKVTTQVPGPSGEHPRVGEVIDGKAELVRLTPEQEREISAIREWAARRKQLAKALGVSEDRIVELW